MLGLSLFGQRLKQENSNNAFWFGKRAKSLVSKAWLSTKLSDVCALE